MDCISFIEASTKNLADVCNFLTMYIRSLYSSSRWVGLKKLFLSELCQITSLPGNSFINIYLQAGLASLKTHNCGTASSSLEDPMHTPEFKLLASSMPYAKHNNSKLICYITKLKMNENKTKRNRVLKFINLL